jgi:hypothetical protein
MMTELGFDDAIAERSPRYPDNEPYMAGFNRGLWERTREFSSFDI